MPTWYKPGRLYVIIHNGLQDGSGDSGAMAGLGALEAGSYGGHGIAGSSGGHGGPGNSRGLGGSGSVALASSLGLATKAWTI